MRRGKKLTEIFWNPKKIPELRNSVEDLGSFFTPQFRDMFELSKEQADDILQCLRDDTTCEKHQSKFFQVKKFITNSLFTEMNIEDTTSNFEVNFPPGADSWAQNMLICGASNSGKSYFAKSRILRNLNGPKKDRRSFLWFSSEWDTDATVEELKKEKYKPYVTGVDISDQAVRDS